VIQLHDKEFIPFITAGEIDFAIKQMAEQIEADFGEDVPLFIGILNGAFMFLSDFLKHYKKPCEVSFVKVASYEGLTSTNKIEQLIGLKEDLSGRSVVVFEDIVDTGNTLEILKAVFKEESVKTCKFATLFFKPDAYKKNIKIDYIGIRIPNSFIVGYGLDYNGLGRNIPEVYQLK
jgi:hypoxanthine phosphoribosyltransferase